VGKKINATRSGDPGCISPGQWCVTLFIAGIGVEVDSSSLGSVIRSKATNGLSGWHWANTKTYAKETTYSKDEIVIILPSADIVSTGAESADDGGSIVKASAGIWIALQGIPIESGPQYHIPKLPMPDETDMDSTSNYWLRISPLC